MGITLATDTTVRPVVAGGPNLVYDVTVTRTGNFTGAILLQTAIPNGCKAKPLAVTPSFDDDGMLPAGPKGSSAHINLTLNVPQGTPAGGPYCLEIEAMGGDDPIVQAPPVIVMFKVLSNATPTLGCELDPAVLTLDLGASMNTVLRVIPMNLPLNASYVVTDTTVLPGGVFCTPTVDVGPNLSSTVSCTLSGFTSPTSLIYNPAVADGTKVIATNCKIQIIPNGFLPVIGSIAPSSGRAGTVVTITGKNFAGVGVTGVFFNGTAAQSFNAVSATTLTAVVPAGATTGTIRVMTLAGSATSTVTFKVTP